MTQAFVCRRLFTSRAGRGGKGKEKGRKAALDRKKGKNGRPKNVIDSHRGRIIHSQLSHTPKGEREGRKVEKKKTAKKRGGGLVQCWQSLPNVGARSIQEGGRKEKKEKKKKFSLKKKVLGWVGNLCSSVPLQLDRATFASQGKREKKERGKRAETI